jgi:hypothetical protein
MRSLAYRHRCRLLIQGFLVLLVGNLGCAGERGSQYQPDSPGHPISTPTLPEASLTTAARVDQLGRELLAANPFLGIEPVFTVVGISDMVLFHPDMNRLMISEGLVNRCRSDDELAAVLAAELGQMAAEKRKHEQSLIPPLPPRLPDHANQNAGGIPSDQTYLAELALYEKKYRQRSNPGPSSMDAKQTARGILRATGRNDATLDEVSAFIEQGHANRSQLSQFEQRSSRPRWTP